MEVRYELLYFHKYNVATDGSEFVRNAVDSVIKLTQLNNAKLYVVHVITLERPR
jgi:nucleotide-binding universal stress UspA family protein